MIDLTNITLDEANKIERLLIYFEKEILDNAKSFEEASTWEDLSKETRNIMKSSAEWWKEIHTLIYKSERSKQ